MPMLTKEAKFIIIDPESLLSPLKGNDDYKELMEYLETRYWKYSLKTTDLLQNYATEIIPVA